MIRRSFASIVTALLFVLSTAVAPAFAASVTTIHLTCNRDADYDIFLYSYAWNVSGSSYPPRTSLEIVVNIYRNNAFSKTEVVKTTSSANGIFSTSTLYGGMYNGEHIVMDAQVYDLQDRVQGHAHVECNNNPASPPA